MLDDSLDKLRSILHTLRVHQAAGAALIIEAEAILAGNATTNDHVKRLFSCWAELWTAAYHEPYVFAGAASAAQFRRLLKTIGVEELEARMRRYLENPDAFFVKNRHPLGVFVATINTHGATRKPSRPALDACAHEPQCPSPWAHGNMLKAEASGDQALVEELRAMQGRASAPAAP